MLTLVENGEIFDPEPKGQGSLLFEGDKIAKIGVISRHHMETFDLEIEVIDATGCLVVPGFLDPHEHLLGGSGEKGFSSQTPEIFLHELVTAGITTVVGCLGVDTTTKTMAGLLAKAKGLRQEGLSAFLYSGGYNVPPTTVMGSVRDDLLYIDEVIGAGEVAIADERSTLPDPRELARLVQDAYVGGILSQKAGVTHFHVGERQERLKTLRTLIDEYEIAPRLLYPTHIERSEELMREAIALTGLGVFVDIDTVEEDLTRWLKFYFEQGGAPRQLTVSSDASIASPQNLFNQIRACILEKRFPVEQVLAIVTSNTARVLELDHKGRLEVGKDADLLVIRKDSFEIKDVFAQGKAMVRDGEVVVKEKFLQNSNRRISLDGAKRQATE
jgi:beta-aspartyl-dipeptidase (metallo-type)